jgi:Carboxypeptidase regulatory-like domain
MRRWPLLLLPVITLASAAQTAKPGTGIVSGHVYCADTNAPARMASVQLKSLKDGKSGAVPHALPSVYAPVGGGVETALDGSFAIPNVPPGSYYVAVTAAGYLSPRPNEEDGNEPEPPPTTGQSPVAIPKVDVQADQIASIDVRIERGAAVSGTIRFDDGSAAAGVIVVVLHRSEDKWVASPTGDFGAFAMPSSLLTDDLGHYRIGGLRADEYIVQATLNHLDLTPAGPDGSDFSGALRNSLAVYSGDTMHRSDAVPFKLGAGEERNGEDISIPLSKLHSIIGVVTAVSDGHPINNGHLEIEEPRDKESIVQAELSKDGTFHLEGVPEGSYLLRVTNASDKQTQNVAFAGEHNVVVNNEKTIHQYGDLEQPIKVEGDVPNLVLSVPEQQKQTASSGPL